MQSGGSGGRGGPGSLAPPPPSDEAGALSAGLAGRLADLQRANAAPDWYWAEDQLTYDNARLPQALIAAGSRLADKALLAEGLRSLDWYSEELGIGDRFVRHVGHEFRRRGTPHPGRGDEQPLDAAALVEAHVEAFLGTGSKASAGRAVHAFEWFLGRNRLGVPVYDAASGGGHDGLTTVGLNDNQGAESTLAFWQAALAMERAGLRRIHLQP